MHIHKCYNSYIEATSLNTWTVNLRSSWFVLPKFEIFGAAKEIKYTFSLHLLLAACVPWLATVVHELYCSTPLWICFFCFFLSFYYKAAWLFFSHIYSALCCFLSLPTHFRSNDHCLHLRIVSQSCRRQFTISENNIFHCPRFFHRNFCGYFIEHGWSEGLTKISKRVK